MKNHIILLLFLLDIFGCAPGYHWAKPDATQQEFVKDSYECERDVEERAYFGRGFMGNLTMQKFFDRCLLAGRYYKEQN
jgi:hypothetical protein